MTDLPEKDEIVVRVAYAGHLALMRDFNPPQSYPKSEQHLARKHLDALTVPDLLALLRERGAKLVFLSEERGAHGPMLFFVRMETEEKPDAVS